MAKKDGVSRRLVIDARVPNSLHRRPPKSSLATPAALAPLNLSEEALALAERDSLLAEADMVPASTPEAVDMPPQPDEPDDPCGSCVDLVDGFCQATAHQVASWFGFDFTMTGAEIMHEFDVDDVPILDEDTRVWSSLGESEIAEACFGGLAMGWSWALFFCHDV